MELARLEISLWREACRHVDLAESISDLAVAIDALAPLEAMWVFALEGEQCALVASHSRQSPSVRRFQLEGREARAVARFVRAGEVGPLDSAGSDLKAALTPCIGAGPVICGPLPPRDGGAGGVAAWRLGAGAADADALPVLRCAIEPLCAALEMSRRFHELEHLRQAAEEDRNAALRRLGRDSLNEPVVGEHSALREVVERASLVAASDVPVLILGETGSGKEVVARLVHTRSKRHDGPFLRVNCGAIPPDLVDSQLFGHERGAFTGATERRLGWFERASGGTLFLDEIGELPVAAQVRLLRVIQEGAIERVGGQETVAVDCRIVAATHRDLPAMTRTGAFREDLWYRLAVFPLLLPPLRERRDDLEALAAHFAHRAAIRFGLPDFEITAEDVKLLSAYHWPGNIRELAAVIDRAALLSEGRRLALAAAMGAAPVPRPADAAVANGSEAPILRLDEAMTAHIERALRACRGKVEGPGGAAAALGANANTLRSKMRKLGIDAAAFRPQAT